MAETLKILETRRSCRAYKPELIEEGKAILKELGIEGDYEGIGHVILGYAAEPLGEAAPRKENYVYYIR